MGHYPIRIRRSNIVKNHVSPNQNTNILFDVFWQGGTWLVDFSGKLEILNFTVVSSSKPYCLKQNNDVLNMNTLLKYCVDIIPAQRYDRD